MLARRRPPRVCWHQPMLSPAPAVMMARMATVLLSASTAALVRFDLADAATRLQAARLVEVARRLGYKEGDFPESERACRENSKSSSEVPRRCATWVLEISTSSRSWTRTWRNAVPALPPASTPSSTWARSGGSR